MSASGRPAVDPSELFVNSDSTAHEQFTREDVERQVSRKFIFNKSLVCILFSNLEKFEIFYNR
jgi:hypothetical protein